MDSFHQLMSLMGVQRQCIDFIKDLPVELAQIVLSKLDTKSLLISALVSRQWLSVCKSTSSFRQNIRRHIRRRNRRLAQVLPPPPTTQFTTRMQSKALVSIPQTKIPFPLLTQNNTSMLKRKTPPTQTTLRKKTFRI